MTTTNSVFPGFPGFNETVYFEHGGRVVSGTVTSIATGGGFAEVVAFSRDLGHANRISDGVRVQLADLLPESHATGQRNALGTVIDCGCARCAATIAEIERQNLGLKIQGV